MTWIVGVKSRYCIACIVTLDYLRFTNSYFEPCKEQEATKLKRRMERLFHMKTCQARILCDDYDSPKYW